MKIKVWSDLHLEFRENLYDHIFDPIWEDPDANKDTTLLLAGDIGVGTGAIPFIEEMCNHFKHVLMICGNHEFYYNEFNKVIADWQAFEIDGPKNFHFLHNDWRILDGVRFLGGTMWTSLNDGDIFTIGACHRVMSDFVEIKHKGERITPDFMIHQHDQFINFLLKKFDEPFDGPTVVMTHHSPGNELRRIGRIRDAVGAAYFADMEQLVGWHNKAKLWVHGHLHDNFDYMINETRVVCNPYGYWNNITNRGFDAELILDVSLDNIDDAAYNAKIINKELT